MSDFFAAGPIIADPESIDEYCVEILRPLVDRYYGDDFSESCAGDRVSHAITRRGIKFYFSAECEDSPEAAESRFFREIYIYIGTIVVDDVVRQRLEDSYKLALMGDEHGEIDPEDWLHDRDNPDGAPDFESAILWSYVRLVFDYDEAVLGEATRYYALETLDDRELIREPVVLDLGDGTNTLVDADDDEDAEDIVTSEEFALLRISEGYLSL